VITGSVRFPTVTHHGRYSAYEKGMVAEMGSSSGLYGVSNDFIRLATGGVQQLITKTGH
jgi:hypothetical protein